MLRNSVDEANDIFAISGDNARLDSYEQEFLHAQLEDYENDEDDARTNLLLSLVVLHANVQCLKKKASYAESGRAAKTTRCKTSTVGQKDTDSSSKILH